jgi:RNA polymerase sigma-70 factor (ECF subfamily)
VVLAAGGEGSSSRLALEELFRIYWAPLYIFARRRGAQSHDAEEQVQSFFSWLLEKSILGRADQARGRFRNFLLVSFKQFLARQAEYAAAAKRRPPHPVLSIDAARAEQFLAEPYHEHTPDREFDYAWALALLHRASSRLRDEYLRDGKEQRYEVLKNCLTDAPRLQGREMAQLLGMTEGAVRVAIHRLKQRDSSRRDRADPRFQRRHRRRAGRPADRADPSPDVTSPVPVDYSGWVDPARGE